jgi:anti-sigma regulatory factor (Ser/Thr protein kinase)
MATLTLLADAHQLASIREFVAQAGKDLDMGESAIYHLTLAVDEACSNAIRHGYGGGAGKIEITVEAVENGVQTVIRDWGVPFRPDAIPVPDITAPLDQRPRGGLGLFIIRKVMDEVQFKFDAESGNTLTMVKRTSGETK